MQLNELLTGKLKINPDSPEWRSTLIQMKVHLNIDTDSLDCFDGMACKFTKSNIMSKEEIADRDVYAIGTNKGVLILGPSTTDLPLVAVVEKKLIRVVESNSKLFKTTISLKTDNETFDFKTSKKEGPALEKMMNKARTML